MKIQRSILEFSTFLIFSTFHAVRSRNLKTPSTNLSDASSHFGLLIGNTFINDSLGNAGHVIIPVYYHTETSLPPTSKSTKTVTKTTSTTEKITSSSHLGQDGQTSHGQINTSSHSNVNKSDNNSITVNNATVNVSNFNHSGNSKTTVKQETSPPSYPNTSTQMTTVSLMTNKAKHDVIEKKTVQTGGQLTTGPRSQKPKYTTPKHTSTTTTPKAGATTARKTRIASKSTTTLKTTHISTPAPSTTKSPTTLPTTRSPTTTLPSTKAPTKAQLSTKTPTITPAPTTSASTTPSSKAPHTTKLHPTESHRATSKTTQTSSQILTINIGGTDSTKKLIESLASTTMKTIPSMTQTDSVKIKSSVGVIGNKIGGNTVTTTVSSSSSKPLKENKEATTNHHFTNTASTIGMNQIAFLSNLTDVDGPTTSADTLSEETSQSDGDKYWPVAMAITIGVPSIIVIGVTISVINRKRTLEKAHSTLLNGYITPPVEYEV